MELFTVHAWSLTGSGDIILTRLCRLMISVIPIEQSCSGQVVLNYEATIYCFYSASFNENCSSGVAISLVNYLVLGSLTTSTSFTYQSLHTYLSHFQFTETQQATFLYCSPKSMLVSGTIISLDTPLSFVWGLVGSGSKLVYYRM